VSKRRRIAVFTGNRAEYGLQYPILRAIKARPDLELLLLVGGAHLDKNFGTTCDEIRKDGFNIDSEIEILPETDDLMGTARAIGKGIVNVSEALGHLKPDILVVYADRFEGFAATIAGTQMRIPTAHVEGGDITQGGALDDSVRHAMTKLAHLHFTTNQQATNRILWMGEEPWRVRTVGMPVLDLVAEGKYASPEELGKRYGVRVDQPVILFTQHSVTTEFDQASAQLAPSLRALEQLVKDGVQVLVTYSNNDAGGQKIVKEIQEFAAGCGDRVKLYASLGRFDYHGLLNLCGRVGRGACVGNSSSGIKETPVFGCPTVNIGSRQEGRLRSDNVIDADYDTQEILAACKKALWDESFRRQCQQCENPYGSGKAGQRIAEVLATIPLTPELIRKKMTLDGSPPPLNELIATNRSSGGEA